LPTRSHTRLHTRFDAVVFDMDGTLIEQMLDFAAIRAELGISPDDGIIEAIERMPPARAAQASRALAARELDAAGKARLMPGAREILHALARAGVKTALLTRNAKQSMELVLSRFDLSFDLAWSRESGPIKPEPDGVLRACKQLGVSPGRTCCVGDFHYDILAANAAGAVSVLLASDANDASDAGKRPVQWHSEADYVIRRLDELGDIVGLS